jgi:hypothetical protein
MTWPCFVEIKRQKEKEIKWRSKLRGLSLREEPRIQEGKSISNNFCLFNFYFLLKKDGA